MLTNADLERYDRDGFLLLPDMFTAQEVAAIQAEIARLKNASTSAALKQAGGDEIRLFYDLHNEKSETPSPLFAHMARMPRMLGLAQQVTRDEALYMFHSKCNLKEAIVGDIFQWHQDYGSWTIDGIPRPDVVTVMVMAQEATELSGCLYFLPASHKLGLQNPADADAATGYGLRPVPPKRMMGLMNELPRPVAIAGRPGTCAIFHSNLIHASGHNLSKDSRWHLYFVYNPVSNKPMPVPNPRPEYKCARNAAVLRQGSDTFPE